MADRLFAVYHKDSGELVSIGDFVQDASHCICSHSSMESPGHPIGTELVGLVVSTDGSAATRRERPLGCTVPGCWHNYDVPTAGLQVTRSSRPGLLTEPVLWADAAGSADAPFVSDPLADDLIAQPLDEAPDFERMRWDVESRSFVPFGAAERAAELRARAAALVAEAEALS